MVGRDQMKNEIPKLLRQVSTFGREQRSELVTISFQETPVPAAERLRVRTPVLRRIRRVLPALGALALVM